VLDPINLQEAYEIQELIVVEPESHTRVHPVRNPLLHLQSSGHIRRGRKAKVHGLRVQASLTHIRRASRIVDKEVVACLATSSHVTRVSSVQNPWNFRRDWAYNPLIGNIDVLGGISEGVPRDEVRVLIEEEGGGGVEGGSV